MFGKKSLAITIALICVLALGTAVLAQGPRGPGARPRGPQCPVRAFMPPPPEAMDRIASELGLNAEQAQKGRELILALNKRIQEIASQGQPMRDLIEALKADPTDPSKVRNLASAAMKQEEAVLQAELETWMSFEKMLNAEQQTKFWNLLLQRPMVPMPGRPPGPGAPPPPGQ